MAKTLCLIKTASVVTIKRLNAYYGSLVLHYTIAPQKRIITTRKTLTALCCSGVLNTALTCDLIFALETLGLPIQIGCRRHSGHLVVFKLQGAIFWHA